jgi:hypothetical protein
VTWVDLQPMRKDPLRRARAAGMAVDVVPGWVTGASQGLTARDVGSGHAMTVYICTPGDSVTLLLDGSTIATCAITAALFTIGPDDDGGTGTSLARPCGQCPDG